MDDLTFYIKNKMGSDLLGQGPKIQLLILQFLKSLRKKYASIDRFYFELWCIKMGHMKAICIIYKLQEVKMTFQKGEQVVGKQKQQPSVWSIQEEIKILEFILMNPNDIIDGPKQRKKMIPVLCKYIQSYKTEKQCTKKIENLLRGQKTFEQLVKRLKKSTQVDNEWISERQNAAQSMGIDYEKLMSAEIKIAKPGDDLIWTEQENKKLLEYVLLYPNRIFDTMVGADTIESIRSHINSTKTSAQCRLKIDYMKKKYPKENDMADQLASKANVDKAWIDSIKTSKTQINAKGYEKHIEKIRQDLSFEEKAQRLFVSDFCFYEALADKETKVRPDQVLLQLRSVKAGSNLPSSTFKKDNQFAQKKLGELNEIIKNNSTMTAKSAQKAQTDNQIAKLRYCLFLAKYKKQFENNNYLNLATPIFKKITDFTQAKYYDSWSDDHRRWMNKHDNNIQKVIDKKLQNLYVRQEQLDHQIKRIEDFYLADFMEEMNAFTKTSRLELTSTDQKVKIVVQKIKYQIQKMSQSTIAGKKQNNSQKENHKNNQTLSKPIQKFLKQKLLIKLPIKLSVTLHILQSKSKYGKKMVRSSINSHNKMPEAVPPQLFADAQLPSKKEKLKEKKRTKNIIIRQSLVEDSEIYAKFNATGQGAEVQQEDEFQDFYQDSGSQQFYYHGEEMSSDFEDFCSQSGQNGNKVDFLDGKENKGDFLVEKQKIPNGSDQLNHSEQKNQEESKTVEPSKKLMQQISFIWTLSERLKITAFLSVNRHIFLGKDQSKKNKILKKLANYVGNFKSWKQHSTYLEKIKQHYNNDFSKAIEQEEKRYRIPARLLQECKQVQDRYKEESSVKIGENSLVLESYPIIIMDPPLKTLEVEIESLIRKGPFVQAKFEFRTDGSKQCPNKVSLDDEVKVVEIDGELEYKIHINFQETKRFGFKCVNEEAQRLVNVTVKSIMILT